MSRISTSRILLSSLMCIVGASAQAQVIFEDYFTDDNYQSSSATDGTVTDEHYWSQINAAGKVSEANGQLTMAHAKGEAGIANWRYNPSWKNGVDTRMNFLVPTTANPNPKLVVEINDISMSGQNYPGNHLYKFMLASNNIDPYARSGITVHMTLDGFVDITSREALNIKSGYGSRFIRLMSNSQKVPGTPRRIILTLDKQFYEMVVEFDSTDGNIDTRDLDANGNFITVPLAGMSNGAVTFRGEHGLSANKWLRSWTLTPDDPSWTGDPATDANHPEAALGASLYLAVQNIHPSVLERTDTVVNIGSVIVSDGQP